MNSALVAVADGDEELSPRQLAFVAAFVGDCRFNGTKAAIVAGYSPASAHNEAYRLLKDAAVLGRIREILAAHLLTDEMILGELAAVATAPAHAFQQIIREYTDANGTHVQVIRQDLTPKVKALEVLAKAAGLLNQQVDVNIREVRTIVGVQLSDISGVMRDE
jgi:phage terminase small subunit